MTASHAALRALEVAEHDRRLFAPRRIRLWLLAALILAFYAASWQLAQVDLTRLARGLPKLGYWVAQAWPPKLAELPLFL
jgi:phosphonate transport system permease protein